MRLVRAFDKVAKDSWSPLPGGVPRSLMQPRKVMQPGISYQRRGLQTRTILGFSGLKTAVLRAVQREVGVDYTFPSTQLATKLTDTQRHDFAASFQATAVSTLVDKTVKAFNEYSPASVVIAGGVAASQALRQELSDRLPSPIQYAPMQLCTDNAAMVATLGYFYASTHKPISPFELDVMPSLSMTKTAWAQTSRVE